MPSDDEKVPGSAPPSEALVEAIRGLVREELKRPPPPPAAAQPPTWRDAFWLLVLVTDVVLFVGLLPEKGWNNPALEIIGKVLPWLGGGTFVLGATWFHDRLLAFSRSRASKMMLAYGFVPLLMFNVRFVPLWPTVEPSGSLFYVDDILQKPDLGQVGFQGESRIGLRLAHHTFKILPHETSSTKERTIEWSWPRLLKFGPGSHQPQWSLIYPLTIVTDGAGCKVTISKFEPKEQLDTDFYDSRVRRVADCLEFEPKDTSETIELPMGKYRLRVEKTGCDPLNYPNPVNVPSVGYLDPGPMKCQSKSD